MSKLERQSSLDFMCKHFELPVSTLLQAITPLFNKARAALRVCLYMLEFVDMHVLLKRLERV